MGEANTIRSRTDATLRHGDKFSLLLVGPGWGADPLLFLGDRLGVIGGRCWEDNGDTGECRVANWNANEETAVFLGVEGCGRVGVVRVGDCNRSGVR